MAGFRFRLLDDQLNLCSREQDFAWNSCPVHVQIFVPPTRDLSSLENLSLLLHRCFLDSKNGIVLWASVVRSFLWNFSLNNFKITRRSFESENSKLWKIRYKIFECIKNRSPTSKRHWSKRQREILSHCIFVASINQVPKDERNCWRFLA